MNTKHLWNLLAIFMIAVLSAGFASCGDDDDDSNPLVGTWVENHRSDDYSYSTFTFRQDGTGTLLITNIVTKNTSNYPFSYSYDEKNQLLSLAYNDGDRLRCGVSVTGKTLVLNFSDEIISLTKQ